MNNLQKMIDERRITRHRWTGTDEQGRSTACLLAALHPPCGAARSTAICPASLMPQWMADLTVWIDDAPSVARWWSIVERYGAIAQRFPELDEARWERASYRVGAAILRIAMPDADDRWGCRRAVAGMIACCESAVETGEIDQAARAKWAAAAAEAVAAAAIAVAASEDLAAAAAGVARAARAAEAAGMEERAEWAARAAAGAAAGATRATRAEWAARADLICDAILDAIEQELTAENPCGTADKLEVK